jgi:hypothetical protein
MLKVKLSDDDDDKDGRVKALRRKYMAANDAFCNALREIKVARKLKAPLILDHAAPLHVVVILETVNLHDNLPPL